MERTWQVVVGKSEADLRVGYRYFAPRAAWGVFLAKSQVSQSGKKVAAAGAHRTRNVG